MKAAETFPAPETELKTAEGQVVDRIPNGQAAAALLAAGIGVFFIGLFTTIVEFADAAKSPVKGWFDIDNWLGLKVGVGPLSGKTIYAVIIWLVAWLVINNMWKGKNVDFGRSFTATLLLIAVGFLLTFPPIFMGLASIFFG